MRRVYLSFILVISSIFAQSASIDLRPQYVDLSASTSLGAVLVSLTGYASDDVRYRLFSGSAQYDCWDSDIDDFVNSTLYSNGPKVPGTPSSSTTFWIIYKIDTHVSTTASYRDRLGPDYSTNYQTEALPGATEITTPFSITGTVSAGGSYDLAQRYIVLGWDGEEGGNLISSSATELTTGSFGLVCPDGVSIRRIEFRTVENDLISVKTNADGWTESTAIGDTPLPVELTTFSAEYANNSVQLNWETATETNNAGFEVQRQNSESGTQNSDWEVLTFIHGHGTTNSPKYYSYTDNDLPDLDKVFYRLRQIDNDGTDAYSKTVEVDLGGVTSVEDEMQFEFALEQNYPNPFNPVTTINFTLPSVGTTHELSLQAKLTVYNLLGQEVRTLVNEIKPAGNYQIQFDASDLPSGIYFYSLTYGNHVQTRKLALLK